MGERTYCTGCDVEIDSDVSPIQFCRDQCAPCYEKEKTERVEPVRESVPDLGVAGTLIRHGVPLRTARAAAKFWLNEPDAFARRRAKIPDDASLFIHGPSGSGKTTLAAALLFAATKEGKSWRRSFAFVSVPQLFADLRRAIGTTAEDERSEHSIMDRLKGVGVLVLDDLGVEKVTDWVLSSLYLLVNHRYEWERRTIFTSNFSLDELEDRFGDARLADRVARWCRVVKMTERK